MKKLLVITGIILGIIWVSVHTGLGDKVWEESNPFRLTRLIVSFVT